jgi:vacuolar-type H+-ATPase subunit C/Vma6
LLAAAWPSQLLSMRRCSRSVLWISVWLILRKQEVEKLKTALSCTNQNINHDFQGTIDDKVTSWLNATVYK